MRRTAQDKRSICVVQGSHDLHDIPPDCVHVVWRLFLEPLGNDPTIAGPLAAGKWSGLQNLIANLAGVVAPLITGIVVDRTGQCFWAFLIAGAVALAEAVVNVFVLGPIQSVDWRRQALA